MGPTPYEIKIKAVQRLAREKELYLEELKEQEAAVNKLKSDPKADQYELKTQVQILEETQKIIPVMRTKLEDHLKDLEQQHSQNPDPELESKYSEAVAAAKKALA